VKVSKRKENMARDKLGPIPDDHFENEPTFPPKNVSPLSKYWIEKIVWWKRKQQDPDKYQPGDVVGGY
jgi:hypothetical protein